MERNDNQPKWLERAKDNLKYGDLERKRHAVHLIDNVVLYAVFP